MQAQGLAWQELQAAEWTQTEQLEACPGQGRSSYRGLEGVGGGRQPSGVCGGVGGRAGGSDSLTFFRTCCSLAECALTCLRRELGSV